MARSDRGRLDQPVDPRRLLTVPAFDTDNFGRLSERFARFLGTGRYLILQTIVVAGWLLVNAVPALRWDGYPYYFMTLVLSLQASYAAPLILLAQNRQADRDRVALEEDRAQYARALADTEFLTREIASLRVAMGDVVTRDFLRSELRAALETIEESLDEHSEQAEPPDQSEEDQLPLSME